MNDEIIILGRAVIPNEEETPYSSDSEHVEMCDELTVDELFDEGA